MYSNEKSVSSSLDWRKTFLIGLGFFTTGISWALYNSYVPLWLNDLIPDRFVVGIIMGLDNLAMIIMEPIVGSISDKTHTRWGRRIPFLMIGIPISAGFFILLPMFRGTLLILMAIVFGFLLMMAFYRAPVVALMPDIVPSKNRSKANGVINLMGGLGAVYAFLFGSMLYSIDPIFAFGSTSLIMIGALVLLFLYVKEPVVTIPENAIPESAKEEISVISSLKEVFTDSDKSCLFVLFAIFFWFVGYNALETWFTSWATSTLPHVMDIAAPATEEAIKKARAAAGFMLTVYALVFVIFAIPAGILGQRLGRARTIRIGLPITIGFIFVIYLVGQFNILTMGPSTQYYAMMILLGCAAFGWALVNINSIVIVWKIATDVKLGSYTGLYYLFSSSAAVLGPGAVGLIFDVFSGGSFELLFPASLFCYVIAFVMMFGVKSGEAKIS
ncbi:MAG: MFS transporter [Candidatus Hodarchaeales archaeon]|jgi:MFS family permease